MLFLNSSALIDNHFHSCVLNLKKQSNMKKRLFEMTDCSSKKENDKKQFNSFLGPANFFL